MNKKITIVILSIVIIAALAVISFLIVKSVGNNGQNLRQNVNQVDSGERDISNNLIDNKILSENCDKSDILDELIINNEPAKYIKYKFFSILESPYLPGLYAVSFGLDPKRGDGRCCENPTGIFMIENGIVVGEKRYFSVREDYIKSNNSIEYADYKYIDNVRWDSPTKISFDILNSKGTSKQFVSKGEEGEFIGSDFLEYTLTDFDRKIEKEIIEKGYFKGCKSPGEFKILREIKNKNNDLTAFIFSLKSVRSEHGIVIIDENNNILDIYYIDVCVGCGGVVEIKDAKWDNNKKFIFKTTKYFEDGRVVGESNKMEL